jgi:hypothetical protein
MDDQVTAPLVLFNIHDVQARIRQVALVHIAAVFAAVLNLVDKLKDLPVG